VQKKVIKKAVQNVLQKHRVKNLINHMVKDWSKDMGAFRLLPAGAAKARSKLLATANAKKKAIQQIYARELM